jgi:NADPH:quinone reductase-like Zn-dependent oxidoreductase
MRALRIKERGGPLEPDEIAVPTPADGEALVRVDQREVPLACVRALP